jgi:uncharacterized protein
VIGFPELKEIMRRHLESDRASSQVEASGDSLEEALSQAAIELGVKIKQLEYDLVEQGFKGVMGAGKKKWKILAYPIQEKQELEVEDDLPSFDGVDSVEPIVVDRNGEAVVHFAAEGVLLKVMPPEGKGKRATDKQAIDKLRARGVLNYNEELISRIVRDARGEYHKVSDFIANPANDAIVTFDIQDQDMKAYVYLTPPGPGGCDASAESILSVLRNNKIVFGVSEDAIRELENRPVYRENVLVAEGSKPVNGKDAYISYNFSTGGSKFKLKEVNGRVNFKELNIVQNVVAGQPLAKKVECEHGEAGKTVTGKLLPAKAGKDMPIPLGRNVHLAEDGVTIISDINGQVILSAGKINVDPIYNVQGDVNLKTGNIIFLGTVIITGNVEDGFSVKAAGNIEILGNVGKSELDAEGDIIVHQGINGKSGGFVRSGKSVWAKFIQNSTIEAAEYVVVSDGIMNSEVLANKKVVCQGRRAAIVGGHIRAAEEINAKSLGSDGGSETVLEVGYDPKGKEKFDGLTEKRNLLKKQLDEVELNLHSLVNLKKQRKVLPEDKEAFFQELGGKRTELMQEITGIDQELADVQAYLNSLKLRGKICASGKVYPGTRIIIKDIKEDIKLDYNKGVTYVLENNLIRTTKYEEPEEDLDFKRKPDAGSAD